MASRVKALTSRSVCRRARLRLFRVAELSSAFRALGAAQEPESISAGVERSDADVELHLRLRNLKRASSAREQASTSCAAALKTNCEESHRLTEVQARWPMT